MLSTWLARKPKPRSARLYRILAMGNGVPDTENDVTWNGEHLSKATTEEKRLCYAQAMHPERWGHVKFHTYQFAVSFFNLSQEEMVTRTVLGEEIQEENCLSVWATMETMIMQEVDLSHQAAALPRHHELYTHVNTVFRALKGQHNEFIVPIVRLLFPFFHTTPLAACCFLPNGFSNPPMARISADQMETLSLPLVGSGLMQYYLHPEQDQKLFRMQAKEKVEEQQQKKALEKLRAKESHKP